MTTPDAHPLPESPADLRTAAQAVITAFNSNTARISYEATKALNALRAALAEDASIASREIDTSGGCVEALTKWNVFNSCGAEVVGGLTLADAVDYLTPSRMNRGWMALSTIQTWEEVQAIDAARHPTSGTEGEQA